MDDHIMYYLGGLFDGEGYAGVYKPCQLICGMQMTDIEGLDILKNTFGGHYHKPRKDSRYENSRILYRLQWSNLTAEEVLKKLNPYLVIKKNQVTLCLEYWEKLKWTPKWALGQLIDEYKEKLFIARPVYANKGGRKYGSRDSYKREIHRGLQKGIVNTITLL